MNTIVISHNKFVLGNVLSRYSELTERNDHNAAALLLVKAFGDMEAVDTMKKIIQRHNSQGFMSPEDMELRLNVTRRWVAALKGMLGKG